jgi:hypothetical protein
VSDHVSHPYTIRGNITFLNILMFTFLGSKVENKRFYTEW